MQIDPFLSPCTKLNSKWIKDLHITPDTLKLTEEKVGQNLEYVAQGKFPPTEHNELCSKIDKLDLIKLQSFGKAKDTVNGTKQQLI